MLFPALVALGALAAAEITTGLEIDLIDPAWRPDRFAAFSEDAPL